MLFSEAMLNMVLKVALTLIWLVQSTNRCVNCDDQEWYEMEVGAYFFFQPVQGQYIWSVLTCMT